MKYNVVIWETYNDNLYVILSDQQSGGYCRSNISDKR